ncbi:MAG: cytochrome c3 family protein [Thermodesulfovibrionales bacterium]|nr:cytochrome c3 family protein [Thermodesulfovibrionales bacterium]
MSIKKILNKIDSIARREVSFGKILVGTVILTILAVSTIVIMRMILVPSFTAANNDYRYQWHRVANQEEWKNFKVKYKGDDYCIDCHSEQHKKLLQSVHAKITCENCHGAALEHPENPIKLIVDKKRELCLRCHSYLSYRPVEYKELQTKNIKLKMIKPDEHYPDSNTQCISCHDPHMANFK